MGKLAKAVGAGLGMAVAAAAGAIFVYGKSAKNRKEIKGWMLKMKGEILQTLERLKHVNEDAYHKTVDQVADRYKKLKTVNQSELKGLVTDLKSTWNDIKKQIKNPKLDEAEG